MEYQSQSSYAQIIKLLHILDIWDTAGQESFNELHPSYYFGAHAAILVFDASRKVTYQNLKGWYKEMRQQCPKIPCICIANKIDIDERATQRKYKFVEDLGVPFNFVSAADGTNVVLIFKEALDMAIKYKEDPDNDDFMKEVMDLLGEWTSAWKYIKNASIHNAQIANLDFKLI